jgi:hypothetical protein
VETKRRTPAVSRQARDGDGEQNGQPTIDPARLVMQDAERPLTVGDVGRGIAGAPAIAVACDVLRRRAGNGGLLVEGMFALALVFVVFWFGGDTAFLFSSATLAFGALTVIGAVVTAHDTLDPAVYVPLERQYSRTAVVRGLVLARGGVACAICLLAVLVALAFHQITGMTPDVVFAGALGLTATCVVLATLGVALTPPVTTRAERLIFLAALDIALYSLTSDDVLARALWLTRLPLLPLAAFYGFAATGQIGRPGLLALLVAGGYVAGLTWLADRLLARHVYPVAREPQAQPGEQVTPTTAAAAGNANQLTTGAAERAEVSSGDGVE